MESIEIAVLEESIEIAVLEETLEIVDERGEIAWAIQLDKCMVISGLYQTSDELLTRQRL